ncbi:MAG: glycosyltransferase family 2 protein [Parasporobacterium sp.]|nr:glycosyltransferase family 2 protein [Parasporobacterium sp.]
MKIVDIVVPAYNEEEGLPEFYKVLKKLSDSLSEFEFRFVFVNDGSSDRTLDVIKDLASRDSMVRYISFSRNFGKEAAIYAGLQHSVGDYTVLMDADLQHPPELIPEMLKALESGEWDACGAKRRSGTMSRLFTSVNNKMSTVKLQPGATDYMCMSRKFVEAVMMLSERQRFTKGLFAWVGFRVKWFDYVQNPRTQGTSKWKFRQLLAYAMDGISGFSTIPLKLVTWSGAIICLLAILYIIITLIKTLICGIDVPGYVTTLVIILFLGGVVLLSVGILGDYIGRIFLEIKNRPLYIAESTNIEEETKDR